MGLHLLYILDFLVNVDVTDALRTRGCTFTRVAFFVCMRVNPLSVGVWRVCGLVLRPRLNGVLMALEGGGSEKVRVSVPGSKMDVKTGVDIQLDIQTGYSFSG